jgi:uncharacterized membrane protein YphA (DoxX/SURF4 family)
MAMPWKNRLVVHRAFLWTARIILGVLFVWASLHKIHDPQGFAQIVQEYKILPSAAVNLFAIVFPWLELVTGLFLLLNIFPEAALLMLGFLLVGFIFILVFNIFRGITSACGCFSNVREKGSALLIILRDLLLLFLVLLLFLSRSKK